MQTIIKKFTRDIVFNRYFNDDKICFIDIETTGLSRVYNSIYLIGILYFDQYNKMWNLTQLLAESVDEEKEVLLEFIKYITNYDIVITYNGESFDIPFINQRLDKHNIPYKISMDSSMDLYRIVRDNRYFLNLESLKLKSIEKYLGLFRQDIYTGKDCIDFYLEYTKSKDLELANRILQHNYDDLYYMIDVIQIMDVINEKRTIIFEYDNCNTSLFIKRIEVSGDLFLVYGNIQDERKIKLMYYDNSFNITFDDDNNFKVAIEYSIGLVSPTEKGLYIDKNKIAPSKNIQDSTIFKLPSHILLLKVGKEYCIDNIKAVIKNILILSRNSFK